MLAITFQVTFKECKQTFFTATNLCSSLIVKARQFVVEAFSVVIVSISESLFKIVFYEESSIFVSLLVKSIS